MTASTDQARALAESLREIADFIETRPNLADAMGFSLAHLGAYPHTVEKWQHCLDELGVFAKRSAPSQIHAERLFGACAIDVVMNHEDVCERVQVGERIEEVAVYPEDVTPEIVQQTVPVYEWKCPSSWRNPAVVA